MNKELRLKVSRVFILAFGVLIAPISLCAGEISFSDGFENPKLVIACPSEPQALATGRCEVTQGDDNLLIRSHFASPEVLYTNAELLIDSSGTIQCAACDCSDASGYTGATVMNCPEVLTSPGLINSHDHLTFQSGPADTGTERYDHRHEWRRGSGGHTQISSTSDSSAAARAWSEIRQLLGGATSMIGSGSAAGLVRNLDRSGDRDGLQGPNVRYSTFPLGDSQGTQISSGCDYPSLPSPNTGEVYHGHFANGVNAAARNEWVCSIGSLTGIELSLPGPSIVHGIALSGADIPSLKTTRASLIWSPRSDIMLYGMTAPVTLLADQGINVALGTDWVVTGSMNMLRELSCALEHNGNGLSNYFSDKDLLKMATSSAALAAGIDSFAGKIAQGYIADLTLFDASTQSGYAAAVRARQEDIVLVLKAGLPLYGDGTLVDALTPQPGDCELMGATVAGDCMADRRLCVTSETGFTYAELIAAAGDLHPLYSCGGAPAGEPTCTPARNEGDGIVFTGIPGPSDSDGDGVANDTDNCPAIFNPPRPVDNFEQGDGDEDGIGDVCDDELSGPD